jgi:hypothetical protein
MTMSISADGHVVLARLRDAGEDEDADAGAGEQRRAEPVEAGHDGRGQPYSRVSKPSVASLGTPMSGACAKIARLDSRPASAQATVPTPLDGMPSSAARSAFSAAARTAMPIGCG